MIRLPPQKRLDKSNGKIFLLFLAGTVDTKLLELPLKKKDLLAGLHDKNHLLYMRIKSKGFNRR